MISQQAVLEDGYTIGGARFSGCQRYRYELTRVWDTRLPIFVVIALNPSKATHLVPDPTVTRLIGFAKREGCGTLVVLNIFAFRSTDPYALYMEPSPIGDFNDTTILSWLRCRRVTHVIAAWGGHGKLHDRGRACARFIRSALAEAEVKLTCFKINADGTPKHPLYVRADAPLIPYLETT